MQWTESGWMERDCNWPADAGLVWNQELCRCDWGPHGTQLGRSRVNSESHPTSSHLCDSCNVEIQWWLPVAAVKVNIRVNKCRVFSEMRYSSVLHVCSKITEKINSHLRNKQTNKQVSKSSVIVDPPICFPNKCPLRTKRVCYLVFSRCRESKQCSL